jgi:hypothetical protein
MIKPRTIIWILALSMVWTMGTVWAQMDGSHQKPNVIIDPSNKQNIRGNISIAFAWGDHFSPPQPYLRGLINLKDAMLKWTQVDTAMENHLMLGSPRLLDMAFVYVTSDNSFDLSDTEKANIKKYLKNGGFMMIENPDPSTEAGPVGASLKQMIRDALGQDVVFGPIPNTNGIYHSFFDFMEGPPQGSEMALSVSGDSQTSKLTPSVKNPVVYLEGVWIDDRLAVVYSNKGYIVKWTQMTDNDPQLKMGVNLIVFALTQEGGIATKKQQ